MPNPKVFRYEKKFLAGGGDLNKIQKLSKLSKEQRRFLDDGLIPLIKSTGPEAPLH